MSPLKTVDRLTRHRVIGPHPTTNPPFHAADCTCGWSGPIVGSYSAAVETWQKHKENARNRSA